MSYCFIQMVELYKDPQGEMVFRNTTTNATGDVLPKVIKDDEITTLKKRINQLEAELKTIEVAL